MSTIREAMPEPSLAKVPSETKSTKSIRKVSRLPKCTQTKLNSSIHKGEHSESNALYDPSMDFTTRMKMKNKISELQQLNNEYKFKLTGAEMKLRSKDGELIAADSLNKQLKHLLDKHINREQELNSQILSLEKKIVKISKQLSDVEEERSGFMTERSEIENSARANEELKENLVVKEAQILDLSDQIAEMKQTLSERSMKIQMLESQLADAKKIQPMLEVRGTYINTLEEKMRHLERLYASMNKENCKLKNGINRLENFLFHSLLESMGKTTNLLQIDH